VTDVHPVEPPCRPCRTSDDGTATTIDRTPRLGDVVRLPSWLPARPYRVLEVRDPGIDGHVWLRGYLIDDLPRTETWHLVQVAQVRMLPDPTFGGGS